MPRSPLAEVVERGFAPWCTLERRRPRARHRHGQRLHRDRGGSLLPRDRRGCDRRLRRRARGRGAQRRAPRRRGRACACSRRISTRRRRALSRDRVEPAVRAGGRDCRAAARVPARARDRPRERPGRASRPPSASCAVLPSGSTPDGVLFLELGAGADAFAARASEAAADRARVRARRRRRARDDGCRDPGIPSRALSAHHWHNGARRNGHSELDPLAEQGQMAGDTYGRLFTVTTFGESHGPAMGCVVDGCPPGLELTEADIQKDLDRRRPGRSRHVTQRQEPDQVKILSGVFEGRTTGTAIGLLVENVDQKQRRLLEDQGQLSARPRRLHVSAEVRHSRLSRRRPLVGARDCHARRGRCDRAQVSRRAPRPRDSRLSRRDRPVQAARARSRSRRRQPVLLCRPGQGAAARGVSSTSCAAAATRSARASI